MKIHSFLIAILMFICGSAMAQTHKQGDVNLDGSVDISDIVAVINTIAGNTTYKSTADVNGDKTIDISDIVAIINIIANGGVEINDPAVEAGLCPDKDHPHIIDMGKAGKWACCNVGASAPWEYGGYYAWGETEEKDYYGRDTYIHFDGSSSTCHSLGSDIAGTQYDVAHVKWGGKWRMPSLDQIKLLLNCTSEWTEVNGINGRKFTAPNGGSIFLPAAGGRWNDELYYAGDYGGYWSSTQYPDGSYYAYGLGFTSGYMDWYGNGRGDGQSVRPVTE